MFVSWSLSDRYFWFLTHTHTLMNVSVWNNWIENEFAKWVKLIHRKTEAESKSSDGNVSQNGLFFSFAEKRNNKLRK